MGIASLIHVIGACTRTSLTAHTHTNTASTGARKRGGV